MANASGAFVRFETVAVKGVGKEKKSEVVDGDGEKGVRDAEGSGERRSEEVDGNVLVRGLRG